MNTSLDDPYLVDKIVSEVKSHGVFDQFRRDCMSDVDTKPAYQNLRQRVEISVSKFLSEQIWTPDTNKIQLREKLRRHVTEAGFLETGVERIVDQVVNPKISTVFQPEIEDILYKYLGIEKPPQDKNEQQQNSSMSLNLTATSMTIGCTNGNLLNEIDLMPNDLESVSSPDSVKSEDSDGNKSNDALKNDRDDVSENDNGDCKVDDEEESPPFEPLEGRPSSPPFRPPSPSLPPPLPPPPPLSQHDNENHNGKDVDDDDSSQSKLSAISGLTSQDSIKSEPIKTMNDDDDCQLSQVSSSSHLSIVTTDDEEYESNSKEKQRQKQQQQQQLAGNDISEEAQMPKVFENSDLNNESRPFHFDINRDEIKFEGTERKGAIKNLSINENDDITKGEYDNSAQSKETIITTSTPATVKDSLTVRQSEVLSSPLQSMSSPSSELQNSLMTTISDNDSEKALKIMTDVSQSDSIALQVDTQNVRSNSSDNIHQNVDKKWKFESENKKTKKTDGNDHCDNENTGDNDRQNSRKSNFENNENNSQNSSQQNRDRQYSFDECKSIKQNKGNDNSDSNQKRTDEGNHQKNNANINDDHYSIKQKIRRQSTDSNDDNDDNNGVNGKQNQSVNVNNLHSWNPSNTDADKNTQSNNDEKLNSTTQQNLQLNPINNVKPIALDKFLNADKNMQSNVELFIGNGVKIHTKNVIIQNHHPMHRNDKSIQQRHNSDSEHFFEIDKSEKETIKSKISKLSDVINPTVFVSCNRTFNEVFKNLSIKVINVQQYHEVAEMNNLSNTNLKQENQNSNNCHRHDYETSLINNKNNFIQNNKRKISSKKILLNDNGSNKRKKLHPSNIIECGDSDSSVPSSGRNGIQSSKSNERTSASQQQNNKNKSKSQNDSGCYIQNNNDVNVFNETTKYKPSHLEHYNINNNLSTTVAATTTIHSFLNVNSKENDCLTTTMVSSSTKDKINHQIVASDKSNSAVVVKNSQRYTNEDLYKPRPILSQRSRKRGIDPCNF